MIGLLGGIVGIALSYMASFAINKYGGPLFETLMQSSGVYDVGDAKFSVIPFWLALIWNNPSVVSKRFIKAQAGK